MTRPSGAYAATLIRLSAAGKSNRGAAAYSRWVNRPLGRRLAAIAYLGGLTPNQISIFSALSTAVGIALPTVFQPCWPVGVAATAALVVGYALDSADGQVARLRGGGSASGEWLDHVLDALKLATYHLAVLITWYRFFHLGSDTVLLVPLGFSAIGSTFFAAIVLADLLRRLERVRSGGNAVATASVDPSEHAGVLRSLIVIPNDYGVLCLLPLLLPLHTTYVTVYVVLAASNLVYLVVGSARWLRELTPSATD